MQNYNLIKITSDNLRAVIRQELVANAQLLSIFANKADPLFCLNYVLLKEKTIFIYQIEVVKQFPSIATLWPASKLYEREICDMYGLFAEGYDNLRPIFLFPENWPSDIHPLVTIEQKPRFEKSSEYKYTKVAGEGVYQILVGPIHAGIIEPGHFRFSLNGESIIMLENRLGWKHRGIEKLAEGKTLSEFLKVAERISGDNNVNIGIAYLQAVEYMLGLELNEDIKNSRMILAELERIWSHVRDFAWMLMDIAYTLPAQRLFALQEELLRLNKQVTGSRFMFGALSLGGVEIGNTATIASVLQKVSKAIKEATLNLGNSFSALDRMQGTGRIFDTTAKELALTGISARASGVFRDTRIDLPYLNYQEVKLGSAGMQTDGDVDARLRCRISEIFSSIEMILELINKTKDTSYTHREKLEIKKRSAVGNAETPRGNAFFYIETDANQKISRLKYTDPSFRNWPALQYAVLGDIVADFPLINKSFNLSYAGNDL